MRSTPIERSTRSTASAPVVSLLSNIELGQQFSVALVLRAHVGAELLGRHRVGEVYRQRLEALEHCRLLHHLLHLAVQALERFTRRAGGRIETKVRTAVYALDAF